MITALVMKGLMVAEEIDILMITETKLDDSFPASQFSIQDFRTPFRIDRNKNGGGILLYIIRNITHQQN